MRLLYLTIFFTLSVAATAQIEKPALITDRPDQTESSVVVPFRFLQIETGFLMENINSGFDSRKAFSYNTT